MKMKPHCKQAPNHNKHCKRSFIIYGGSMKSTYLQNLSVVALKTDMALEKTVCNAGGER